jgi:hypothetical protein
VSSDPPAHAAEDPAPAGDPAPADVPPAEVPASEATTVPLVSAAEPAGNPLGRVLAWYRRRKRETEARWELILGGVRRTGTITKVILLHARYTFGYLSAGFLLSAPFTIGWRHGEGLEPIAKSVILGVLCAIPFGLLIPFSQIDWGRMRLPEFKNLEVALTRYATYTMVGVLVAFLGVQAFVSSEHFLHWLCDVRVAWINLFLMLFAWVRTKFHVVLFRDFYTLKPGDDLVLSAPSLDEDEAPTSAGAGDPALAGLLAQAGEAQDAEPAEDRSDDSEQTTLSP